MQKKCNQCPRKCSADFINRENNGFCKTPYLPKIARAGLHFGEEPCIAGKNGAGAIFFTGCNLHCVFCQNHDISSAPAGKEISVSRLREIYFELIAQGAHNINLVTPTHFTESILKSLEGGLPVPVVWNSNGYESAESLQKLEGKIQIFLPDLKYADNAIALRYSKTPDYFERAAEAIEEMYRQTGPWQMDDAGILRSGVVIRHLILPGCVENSKKVIDFVARRFKPGEVFFSLMRQYLPCGKVSEESYPELNRRVTDEEYQEVEDCLISSGIEDGFVQDAESASGDFIPHFDGTGV